MKNHLCERISAARTYGCMQHRRPLRFPAPTSRPVPQDTCPDDHFAAVIQSCEDAIIVKTLSGIVTSWNKGAEHLFGYTEKEMIGQSMLRLFPIVCMDEEYYIIERILNGEQVPRVNTVRICKNGTPVDVSVSISPVRDKEGSIVGASIIARDITEQIGLESDARQFRALLDCSDDAIITETLDGRICSWNGAARTIFGYSAEETVGQPMLRLLPEERVDEEAFILGNIMAGEKIDHFETVRIRKDGESIHVSTTALPIRDRLGNIVGASQILRDITPLRRQQEQLEHIAHLDILTGLPNRLLLSDRLRQAIAASKRTGRQFAVLYLDLDEFKRINDIHGHAVGDAMLGDISRRIAESLGTVDTLARIGGDEFVAVLANIGDNNKLTRMLDRILASCSAPVCIDDKRLEISASIGVTLYPQDDVNEDQLMRHANLAMYEAKQAGKNRYHLFDVRPEAEGKDAMHASAA